MTNATLPSLPVTQSEPATDAPTNCAVSTGSTAVIVELSQLAAVLAYLRRIESVPLADITWLNNGEAVKLTPEQIDEWRFTGLNNRDFARDQLLSNTEVSNDRERKGTP